MGVKTNETTKLLDKTDNHPNNADYKRALLDKIWPYLVTFSCFLTYVAAAGFNYGISGSITEVQSKRFGVSISQASWTTSVHAAFFFMSGIRYFKVDSLTEQVQPFRTDSLVNAASVMLQVCTGSEKKGYLTF